MVGDTKTLYFLPVYLTVSCSYFYSPISFNNSFAFIASDIGTWICTNRIHPGMQF